MSRRNDIIEVAVTYADGSTVFLQGEEIREAVSVEDIHMDSKEGRDRQEWDLFEVRVAGPKRKVREAPQ